MAEAIVDGTPVSRFFCHKCSVELERLLPDFTCPHCTLGFIEQLESGTSGGSGSSEDDPQGDGRGYLPYGSSMDISGEDFGDIDLDFEQEPDDDFIRMHLNFPQGDRIPLEDRGIGGNVGRPSRVWGQQESPAQDRGHVQSLRNLERRMTNRVRLMRSQEPQLQQVNHMIENFILNLYDFGLHLPAAEGGAQPVIDDRLFLGNPGDYVWGRDGLDSIVTQLLNQMDGTGPPPLPRKQIDEIPTATVSQSQIDSKLQCSICWEDFALGELVRELPCNHIYHTPCIEPWLELHGTCPICRQSLGDQSSAEANRDTVGPNLAAIFRQLPSMAANQATNSRTPSASSSDE